MRSKVVDKDRGFKATMAAARQLAEGAYAKVGILGNDSRGGLHHTDPDTGLASPLTIAETAVVNEFGTDDGFIPARPAHRSTFDNMRPELERAAAKLLDVVVHQHRMTVEAALNILGAKLATGIRNTITQGPGVPPPNAPYTAQRKARGKGAKRAKAIAQARPLVDTGATVNAITWAVFLGTVEKAHRYLTGRGP